MLYIANSSRIVVLAFVLYLFYSSTFHVYFDDFEARLLLLLIPTIETTWKVERNSRVYQLKRKNITSPSWGRFLFVCIYQTLGRRHTVAFIKCFLIKSGLVIRTLPRAAAAYIDALLTHVK
jgi:hypothetical protein